MLAIDSIVGLFLLLVTLIAPGYSLLLGFYSKKMDVLERVILGIGLSIVMISLSVVLLNKVFSIPIDYWTDFGIVVFWSILGIVKWKIKKNEEKRN
jgi:uncharacterized membrane protein